MSRARGAKRSVNYSTDGTGIEDDEDDLFEDKPRKKRSSSASKPGKAKKARTKNSNDGRGGGEGPKTTKQELVPTSNRPRRNSKGPSTYLEKSDEEEGESAMEVEEDSLGGEDSAEDDVEDKGDSDVQEVREETNSEVENPPREKSPSKGKGTAKRANPRGDKPTPRSKTKANSASGSRSDASGKTANNKENGDSNCNASKVEVVKDGDKDDRFAFEDTPSRAKVNTPSKRKSSAATSTGDGSARAKVKRPRTSKTPTGPMENVHPPAKSSEDEEVKFQRLLNKLTADISLYRSKHGDNGTTGASPPTAKVTPGKGTAKAKKSPKTKTPINGSASTMSSGNGTAQPVNKAKRGPPKARGASMSAEPTSRPSPEDNNKLEGAGEGSASGVVNEGEASGGNKAKVAIPTGLKTNSSKLAAILAKKKEQAMAPAS